MMPFVTHGRGCPACGHRTPGGDRVSDAHHPAAADDFALCTGCGEILQFDGALNLVRASEPALAQLRQDAPKKAWLMQTAQRLIIRDRASPNPPVPQRKQHDKRRRKAVDPRPVCLDNH